jgi:hypothetical protein
LLELVDPENMGSTDGTAWLSLIEL